METMKIKPYMLLAVKTSWGSFIGEAMSFPFASTVSTAGSLETRELVMVRRVPGHPGTLEEVSLDIVSEVEQPSRFKFVHYAHVAGKGGFPYDMLRSDQCVPVNFTLVEQEPYGYIAQRLPGAQGTEGLVVAQVSTRRFPNWTEGRWNSFLWSVRELVTETIEGERVT